MREPVDAVITWVDGHDSRHKTKLTEFLASNHMERPESAAPTRFNQSGEIDYCLKSVLQFLPWIRKIYIVTDAQTPAILLQDEFAHHPKIKLVDHKEIFKNYEYCLPTFNSLSIESMLWRIEGLTDKFIYLNDDCFITKPMKYEDFFQEEKLVLRGLWKRSNNNPWRKFFRYLGGKSAHNPHSLLQERSAHLAGFHKQIFHLPHLPFPMHRRTLEEFFHKNARLLSDNIRHPFRDPSQFWVVSLAYHLAIHNGQAVFDDKFKEISIDNTFHSSKKIRCKLKYADKSRFVYFLNIQSMDLASPNVQKMVFHWMDKKIDWQRHTCNASI